jgi:hypothetical protein
MGQTRRAIYTEQESNNKHRDMTYDESRSPNSTTADKYHK